MRQVYPPEQVWLHFVRRSIGYVTPSSRMLKHFFPILVQIFALHLHNLDAWVRK